MLEIIDVSEATTLDDYEAVAHLSLAVRDLRSEATALAPALEGRTVWMVNSTARGGGVAEMLPRMLKIFVELGVDAKWAVIGTDRNEFFDLTKRIHNLIHGVGEPSLSNEDRELYDDISRKNAEELEKHVKPHDILVIHDPQPLGVGAILKKQLGLPCIWRCHIGVPERTSQTKTIWRFLRDDASVYDHALFSAPDYIPDFLAGRASILHPAIDPISDKNRDLRANRVMGILCSGAIAKTHCPVLPPRFDHVAQRLCSDGEWRPAAEGDEPGIIYRPIVTQVSRWDRLKGFKPLLDAFVRLKTTTPTRDLPPDHRRRLELVRLVMAGPDPASILDDPEGLGVIEELSQAYVSLPEAIQRDVIFLSLPMHSRQENALMVNAIQRCSAVVVQNSLQEGFGLTATEAMWKRVPMLGTQACGLRQQVRDGIDGRLISDPEDVEELCNALDTLLADPAGRAEMGRNGQRRVHDSFLVFAQVRNYLQVLSDTVHKVAES